LGNISQYFETSTSDYQPFFDIKYVRGFLYCRNLTRILETWK